MSQVSHVFVFSLVVVGSFGFFAFSLVFFVFSGQHLQVLMTQLHQKHWKWPEDRKTNVWHGSEKRPTMYVASMDINTAFVVARPKHIAKMMGDQDVHGWITTALLREMTGMDGQTTFEIVESKFQFTRCIRQEKVEATRFWQANSVVR